MTMRAAPVVDGPSSALDLALAVRDGPGAAASFVNAVAPAEALRAVQCCLPRNLGKPVLRLVRAKLKPGRKLTVEYGVVLPVGPERRIVVTWVAPGATAPGPAAVAEAEARRRDVLAPFLRAWTGSHDERMSMSVAPVDGDFPQLVRLHDRAHLADVLRGTSALGRRDVSTEDVRVEAVRYRPGQRHVLRVGVGAGGPAWFAKVYRDDTGRRTVQAAMRAATAFAEAGDGAVDVAPPVGGYVAADRTAFWSEVPGMSLAEEIAVSACAASDLVRTAGSALRLLHEVSSAEGLQVCPDASAQAGETLRTAQLIDALAPAVGSRLRREVGRALEWLTALPAEPPTLAHGDFKCDNLLVSGSRVHVLDFDRLGRGDPAADIGKFLADLRWCAGAQAGATERLHEAFRRGYGPADPARVARARAYDALLQLRMAARRVPIQDPEWEGRVVRAVGVAAATLDGAS